MLFENQTNHTSNNRECSEKQLHFIKIFFSKKHFVKNQQRWHNKSGREINKTPKNTLKTHFWRFLLKLKKPSKTPKSWRFF